MFCSSEIPALLKPGERSYPFPFWLPGGAHNKPLDVSYFFDNTADFYKLPGKGLTCIGMGI